MGSCLVGFEDLEFQFALVYFVRTITFTFSNRKILHDLQTRAKDPRATYRTKISNKTTGM